MNKDRMSAWLDNELDETELEALLADFSTDEQCAHYLTYTMIGSSMRGQFHATQLNDIRGLARLREALEPEHIEIPSWFERMKSSLAPERMVASLQSNWAPLAAAVIAVSAVVFYPTANIQQQTNTIIDATSGSGTSIARVTSEGGDLIEEFIEARLDDYVSAHESISPLIATQRGGLGTIRAVVYSDSVNIGH